MSAISTLTSAPLILAALLALVGVIFGAIVTYLISRRSIYINSVTVERTKWIGELRTNIAKLSGQVLNISHSRVSLETVSEENYRSWEREIYELSALIKLQLNPSNEIDRNLLRIIDEFTDSLNNPTHFRWAGLDMLLVSHAQWLLKAEWEKVKAEAAGLPCRPWFWARSKFHIKRYRKFASGAAGSID